MIGYDWLTFYIKYIEEVLESVKVEETPFSQRIHIVGRFKVAETPFSQVPQLSEEDLVACQIFPRRSNRPSDG